MSPLIGTHQKSYPMVTAMLHELCSLSTPHTPYPSPAPLSSALVFSVPRSVFCVRFSGDGSYVLSGSDDTNIRLWKAQASQQLGMVSA